MCIKFGDDELDTVRSLMTMSLNAIIADIFNLDMDQIKPELSLQNDLSMSDKQEKELLDTIAEYFDDLRINLKQNTTLNDLFESVVLSEFKNQS